MVVYRRRSVTRVNFLFSRTCMVLYQGRINFNSLITSTCLTASMFLQRLRIIYRIPTFSSNCFIRLPHSFHRFPRDVRVVPICARFKSIRILIKVRLRITIRWCQFFVNRRDRDLSNCVLTNYFRFPFRRFNLKRFLILRRYFPQERTINIMNIIGHFIRFLARKSRAIYPAFLPARINVIKVRLRLCLILRTVRRYVGRVNVFNRRSHICTRIGGRHLPREAIRRTVNNYGIVHTRNT